MSSMYVVSMSSSVNSGVNRVLKSAQSNRGELLMVGSCAMVTRHRNLAPMSSNSSGTPGTGSCQVVPLSTVTSMVMFSTPVALKVVLMLLISTPPV